MIFTRQKPREKEPDNNVLMLPYNGQVSKLFSKQIDDINIRFHINLKFQALQEWLVLFAQVKMSQTSTVEDRLSY